MSKISEELKASGAFYRKQAREHFARAEELLAAPNGPSLRYACLELRLCIEALCTGRLVAYRQDLDRKSLMHWQPKKIIQELIAVDAGRDWVKMECRFKPDGQEAWLDLGTEYRFSAKWAHEAHNALGNALHVPSIGQFEAGKAPNDDDMRRRSEKFLPEIRKVLSSKAWDIKLPEASWNIPCDCGFVMMRRVDALEVGNVFSCSDCARVWAVDSLHEDGSPDCHLRTLPWTCRCGTQNWVPEHAVAERYLAECSGCGCRGIVHRRWAVHLPTETTAAPAKPPEK